MGLLLIKSEFQALCRFTRDFVVTGKEKAVCSFLVASVGSYVVQNHVSLHSVLSVYGLKALVLGVIAHQMVYWVQNSEE